MKRTTYIIIGLFVAGLCILVGGMVTVFFLGRPIHTKILELQGETLIREVPACRVIQFSQTELSTDDRRVWFANTQLEVLPSRGEKNILSCSEKLNNYLTITEVGDTLKIHLDYPQDKLSQEFEDVDDKILNIGLMRLNLAPDVECIIDDINSQEMVFNGLVKDSLSVSTSNAILVDSCYFTALHVGRSGDSARFKSGDIGNLHLSLSKMGNWTVDVAKCHIGTEYLTGHDNYVEYQKGECERMIWIPEKEDSRLNVTLRGKVSVMEIE